MVLFVFFSLSLSLSSAAAAGGYYSEREECFDDEEKETSTAISLSLSLLSNTSSISVKHVEKNVYFLQKPPPHHDRQRFERKKISHFTTMLTKSILRQVRLIHTFNVTHAYLIIIILSSKSCDEQMCPFITSLTSAREQKKYDDRSPLEPNVVRFQ